MREKIYKAYINRGNNNDKNDNKKIITDIVSLRLEKARLLGFDCYSNFVLDNTMAKNSDTVMEFLNNLWNYALPKAKAEAAELQKLMDRDIVEFCQRNAIEFVGNGKSAFAYVLQFEVGFDLVLFEVIFFFAELLGIIPPVPGFQLFAFAFFVHQLLEFGKSGGAWMSNYREQKGDIRPLV